MNAVGEAVIERAVDEHFPRRRHFEPSEHVKVLAVRERRGNVAGGFEPRDARRAKNVARGGAGGNAVFFGGNVTAAHGGDDRRGGSGKFGERRAERKRRLAEAFAVGAHQRRARPADVELDYGIVAEKAPAHLGNGVVSFGDGEKREQKERIAAGFRQAAKRRNVGFERKREARFDEIFVRTEKGGARPRRQRNFFE